MLAPIVLFVYNRPLHLQKTLDALANNDLANESLLFIYSDGPKVDDTDFNIANINKVRELSLSENRFKEVKVIERIRNAGLADSIVNGVTEIVNKYGKVIVLEDDIITSKGFLHYMNDSLSIYENENKVFGVSAFMFPISSESLPTTFFYRANLCWGWGTWSRSWNYYSHDHNEVFLKLFLKKISWKKFNSYQYYGSSFKDQLMYNLKGYIKTWGVKWHSALFIHGGYILHPNMTLCKNIGFDGSGENCGNQNYFDKIPMVDRISINKIKVVNHSKLIAKRLKLFYKNSSDSNRVISSNEDLFYEWRYFLNQLSSLNISFYLKLYYVFINLFRYKSVSFSRYTLGSLKTYFRNYYKA